MYTKEMSEQNRAMIERASELLDHNDIDTVAGKRKDVIAQMKKEFPGVTEYRIVSKIAKVIRQLRYAEKYGFFYPEDDSRFVASLSFDTVQEAIEHFKDRRPSWAQMEQCSSRDEAAFMSMFGDIIVVRAIA